MDIKKNVLELIGNTPIVELTHFDTGPCRLFVKMECQNPAGSIKDRIALGMIEAAEKAGKIKPGDTLIEATSGNTGIGLALVAALKGYRMIITIPDKMSQEKIAHLRALGAEVIIARSDVGYGHPEHNLSIAERLAKEKGYYYIDQFSNPDNAKAHHEQTGPEIWKQMEGNIDAFVCGVGSGGTLSGAGKYLKEQKPELELVLCDPEGSIVADFAKGITDVKAGYWQVEGVGSDFIPSIADLELVDHIYPISNKDAYDTARALLKQEGILAGSSTGLLVQAALRYCQDQTEPKNVLTLVCDSGAKYLSKLFNEQWLNSQGLLPQISQGDLRDFLPKTPSIIFSRPEESLKSVIKKMQTYHLSCLPILGDDGNIVGLIEDKDVLNTLLKNNNTTASIKTIPCQRLLCLSHDASLAQLVDILNDHSAVGITFHGKFLGTVSKIDIINYLQKQ